MPSTKQDETLEATAEAALKQRRLAKAKQVDNPAGAFARFIGTGPLQGVDRAVRILEVTDSRTGQPVNDAVDVGAIHIVLELDGHQVKVEATEGYFTEAVGVLPPGVPTGEPQPGARGLEHDPHAGVSFDKAEQPFQPGQPALVALAGAGGHGDPVPDAEKKRRAKQAEASRVHAAKLSAAGAGGARESSKAR